MNFFTRIDGFNLTPGDKTAGFVLSVSVPAMHVLSTLTISDEEKQRVHAEALKRVKNSGLMSAQDADDCGFELVGDSAVPRYFWVNRMFAASIGAEPAELECIRETSRARELGAEISYTPHNVDVPQHAMVLMILAQAWSEWAWGRLLVADEHLKRVENEHAR